MGYTVYAVRKRFRMIIIIAIHTRCSEVTGVYKHAKYARMLCKIRMESAMNMYKQLSLYIFLY